MIEVEIWSKSTLDIDIHSNRNTILFGKLHRLENHIILINQMLYLYKQVHPFKEVEFGNPKKNIISQLYVETFILLNICKYNEF